jgi:hypothetical protein
MKYGFRLLQIFKDFEMADLRIKHDLYFVLLFADAFLLESIIRIFQNSSI